MSTCESYLEGLLKPDGYTTRNSDSVDIEWGLRMCISDNFPGAADASGPRVTLGHSSCRRIRLLNLIVPCSFDF